MKAKRKICVVGLGYVGLPLLVEFGKITSVVGYDTDVKRVEELSDGIDRNGEVTPREIKDSQVEFTNDPACIASSDFIIVAIPTPIDKSKRPDLEMLKDATATIGRNLGKGSIVVFESTFYPGLTEEVCVPILERESGLKFMKDFKVGYSPERMNPGDKKHTVDKIVKVVSGCDRESLEEIAEVYGRIAKAGVCRAPSIKVAEAAKVIENIQRDLNIALMNELKIIFDKMGIEIEDVIEVAKTKWNFVPFHPGLVGGHCIGVDPYYLAYKAEIMRHHPEVILAGRRVNDGMAEYMVSRIVMDMANKGIRPKGAKVLVLGATFKPNVKDLRNSKVEDVIKGLKEHGCSVDVSDPLFKNGEMIFGYSNVGTDEANGRDYDYVILAVKHDRLKGMKGIDFTI